VKVHATALDTLRRCAEALGRFPAAPERDRLLGLHAAALRMLEEASHRPATLARAARLRQLERQLAYLDPGERAFAIRERMGLSKSGYYKLRGLALRSTDRSRPPDGPIET
jgi:hypothetical protein